MILPSGSSVPLTLFLLYSVSLSLTFFSLIISQLLIYTTSQRFNLEWLLIHLIPTCGSNTLYKSKICKTKSILRAGHRQDKDWIIIICTVQIMIRRLEPCNHKMMIGFLCFESDLRIKSITIIWQQETRFVYYCAPFVIYWGGVSLLAAFSNIWLFLQFSILKCEIAEASYTNVNIYISIRKFIFVHLFILDVAAAMTVAIAVVTAMVITVVSDGGSDNSGEGWRR